MIDRTTFDLRIAQHRGAVARTNEYAWERQAIAPVRPARVALAAALVALAVRLAPTLTLVPAERRSRTARA